MTQADWDRLFTVWQDWLRRLDQGDFQPGWTDTGYTVLGWDMTAPADNIHQLLQDYYSHELNLQQFDRLKNQIQQKLKGILKKSCARKKTPFGTDSINPPGLTSTASRATC